MATARMIFGSMLGTISSTADAVSALVNSGTGSIDMLNRFVQSAATDQRERHVAHRASFRQTLMRDTKMEIAAGNAVAVRFREESEVNQKLFDEAEKMIDDIFSKYDRANP
tara:strand:+ start:11197 stop:11529 length:333 start_codon:yes stop_codon:yes gene_type:complete